MQIIFTPVCKLHISFFRAKIKDGHLRVVFTAFKFTAEQFAEESKGNYLLAEIYFELLGAVRRQASRATVIRLTRLVVYPYIFVRRLFAILF